MMMMMMIITITTTTQKEAEKKLKFKNPSIEIQRMWNMKRFVIPVISEANGIVTKGLKNSGNSIRKVVNKREVPGERKPVIRDDKIAKAR
jgi:hypothetical protein